MELLPTVALKAVRGLKSVAYELRIVYFSTPLFRKCIDRRVVAALTHVRISMRKVEH